MGSIVAADRLMGFLGCSPEWPELDQWLQSVGIFDRPHAAIDDPEWDDDEDLAAENARASEIEEVERHSLCLIYDERADYRLLWGAPVHDGDFILRQVAFYASGVQDYRGFSGQLPLGLTFGMSQAEVGARLGVRVAAGLVWGLAAELYASAEWICNVSYTGPEGLLAIVHVRRPHLYDLRRLDPSSMTRHEAKFSVATLTSLLGRDAYDPGLDHHLAPLGWHCGDEDMAECDEVMDLVPRHGLTLYFRPAARCRSAGRVQTPVDGTVFAGFRCNRRGDMHSQGFDGALPFGIEFHHSPQQVLDLVGRPPDWSSTGDDTMAFRWACGGHDLHVLCSLLDQQVYRIGCFVHMAPKSP